MPTKKTVTYELFTFDELSDSAKETARQWWRDSENSSGDNFYAESVIEDAGTIAGFLGLDIRTQTVKLMGGGTRHDPAIYWSGFSSQGDGACFEGLWSAADVKPGTVVDYAPEDKELGRIAAIFEDISTRHPELSFNVSHSGNYSNAYSTSFDFDFPDREDESGKVIETYNEADEWVLTEAARDFMVWIYRQLKAEYDYTMSDESVDDSITANEYTFDEFRP